jgi:hypothetical protein
VLTDEHDELRMERGETSAATAPGRRRRDRRWAVLLVVLTVVPLIVSAFYLWFAVGKDYLPTVDWALFELGTRDALHHGVFVGPYSRFGWNHPGPLLFYVLSGPYALLGDQSISMHITALLVNAVTLVLVGWVAWRRGRLATVVVVLVPVALLTHALGADVLRNPWNPYLPVLPLLLLLLLAWSVAVGDLWMAPLAIAVASFVIQSHVGLALEAVALLVVALVAVLARGVRTAKVERRRYWVRVAWVAGVSAVVFLILWSPVAYGTFVKHDGNVRRLMDFFTSDHRTAGFHTALRVMGLQWGPKPEWILGPRGNDVLGNAYTEPRWWLAVWLVLGGAAVVVAWRRRAWDTVLLGVLLAVGAVAAVVAVSNIVDLLFPYLNRWTWVLGAGFAILALQGVWLAIPPARRDAVLRWAVPVAAVVIVVVSVMETVDAVNAGTPYASEQRRERVITSEVLAHLPPGSGPVLIETTQAPTIVPGIALALEKQGIPVRVSPSQPIVYGHRRDSNGGPYRAELTVVSGHDKIKAFNPPGPRIAYFSRPLTAADRRALDQFVVQARHTPPGPDRQALLEVARIGRQGPAEEVAVYLSRPG